MARNVGGIDRAVRVIVSLALLAIAFFHIVNGVPAILAYVFGVIAMATAVLGYCPAWVPLGINTSSPKRLHAKTGGQEQ